MKRVKERFREFLKLVSTNDRRATLEILLRELLIAREKVNVELNRVKSETDKRSKLEVQDDSIRRNFS